MGNKVLLHYIVIPYKLFQGLVISDSCYISIQVGHLRWISFQNEIPVLVLEMVF